MSTPFVARAAEVSRLTGALGRSREGEPSLLLVAGDAGVGKTRLLEHFGELARAEGARVVVAHCVDLGEIGLPYLPFAEALSGFRQIDRGAVETAVAARPALGRLLPGATQSEEAGDRLQLFEGLVDVLDAVGTRQRPLLLVLEDLHWSDASSRDVLRFLTARLTHQHVLVVASYRTDDLHRRHPLRPLVAELTRSPRVERVDLSPFTPSELDEFAASVTGGSLPADTLTRVRERSEGNAYFAVELLEAGPDNDTLPWSLADVLRARLDPLDPAVLRVAQVAAVSGRRVSEPLLRAALAADGVVTGPGAQEGALREAVAHHVLGEEDGQIAFRHALLAEVVYGDLLPGEKSALHRAYQRALQESPELGSAAQLAAHALAAPDLGVALAASAAAADEAREVLAPRERLRHLEMVLRLWDAAPAAAAELPTDRTGVLEQAAAAASDVGESERATALLRSALDSAEGDAVRCAALRTLLARVLLAQEHIHEARAEVTRALADLTEPSPQRARALAASAWIALNADQEEEAAAIAGQAVELAPRVGATDAESDALTTLALLGTHQHAEPMLLQALDRALTSGDRHAELRSRFNLASDRYYRGDLTGALEFVTESVERADELGLSSSMYGLELHWLVEVIRYATGNLTPGPGYREPIRGWQGLRTWQQVAGLHAAVARGDDDAVARGLVLMGEWHHDPLILHMAGAATVDGLTWAGRYDEAVAQANQVLDDLSSVWSENFLGGIAQSALALAALADAAEADRLHGREPATRMAAGDALIKRARTTVEQGRPRGGTLGPEGNGWLARAEADHARLHGRDDPVLWERCVEEFSVGFRYETARSRWRWAQSLLGSGDRAGAQEQARIALDEAEAMGARPLAEAVRALARRGRLDLPGVRQRGADVLTAREAEVLALVAQGLTNRQIGEHLFVSDKTVSVHVSNVLAKLGVSGRAEAVAVAHQRGLLAP